MKTKSTPFGSVEAPYNPITAAIMNGASFVARGFSGDTKHLSTLMKQAVEHKGFSLVSVYSPCVTFNLDNDFTFFKPRVKKLEDETHDTSDWKAACEKALVWGDDIYIGLFYCNDAAETLGGQEPVHDQGGPLSARPLGLSDKQVEGIIARMV